MIAVGLCALALVGCYREPEPPRQFVPGNDLYEQFSSDGSRVIIDGDGDRSMKLRNRSTGTRVYNADMIPVGQVRVQNDELLQRSPDGQTTKQADWLDDDTAGVDDGWHIEQSSDGWDVYARRGDDRPVANWHRGEQWSMTIADDPAVYTVNTEDAMMHVVDDDQRVVVQISADDWSPLKALAIVLDDFEPLERYHLARWAQDHLEQ